MIHSRVLALLALLAACFVLACGDDESQKAASMPASEDSASATETGEAPETPAVAAPADDEVQEIDPASLSHSARISINQYSVAFIGSANWGKGTLHTESGDHPFRIGGLGIGGIGVAAIDAVGNVYNLPSADAFYGTYGNARLGMTAADKGRGRLWLRNPNGVVIELWSDMSGLALTGGVDGVVIQSEAQYQSNLDDVKEGANKAWDAVKKPFE